MWLLLTLIAACTYYTGLTARKGEYNGQTFGKQAAGIRVVRDDGRPIRLGFAFAARGRPQAPRSPTSS